MSANVYDLNEQVRRSPFVDFKFGSKTEGKHGSQDRSFRFSGDADGEARDDLVIRFPVFDLSFRRMLQIADFQELLKPVGLCLRKQREKSRH